jgi:hypothetical protein
VDHLEGAGAEAVGQLTQGARVGPRVQLRDHMAKAHHLEPGALGLVKERPPVGGEHGDLVAVRVEGPGAAQCDPAGAGDEARHDLGDADALGHQKPSG